MRILIANRGEIACRIARTAHRMGISTVGIYSEPDRNALHVDSVDVAIALGGSTPAESYLRGDAIIRAAIDTASTAIHPGYGFLAENADFAQAVIDAGLQWIGPTPDQIRLLGDKIAAKRAAIEAGVPTTAIVEAASGSIPERSIPSNSIRPLVGSYRPASNLMSVDLPAPFSPTMATTVPAGRSRSTLSSTTRSLPG